MVLVQTLRVETSRSFTCLSYFPAPCRLKQKQTIKRGSQAERLCSKDLSVAVLPHIIAPGCLISSPEPFPSRRKDFGTARSLHQASIMQRRMVCPMLSTNQNARGLLVLSSQERMRRQSERMSSKCGAKIRTKSTSSAGSTNVK